MEEKIQNLGTDVLKHLHEGPIPNCVGMILITVEQDGNDVLTRVTPQGTFIPEVAALIGIINKQLGQSRCMNCGDVFPIEGQYHDPMGGEFCSEKCSEEYTEYMIEST
jgi:hypothetical protein